MFKVNIFLIILFSFSVLNAQNSESGENYDSSELQYFQPGMNFGAGSTLISPDNDINYSISMGSSFTRFGSTDILTGYTAPMIHYKVNPRFRLTAGTIMTYSNFTNQISPVFDNSTMSYESRLAKYYMFAKGEYQVSERLNLRGSTLVEVNPAFNSGRTRIHNIGFDLNLGGNSFLHADFSFGNISNPYDFYNPHFGHYHMFGNRTRPGFGHSPFFY